MYLLRSILIGIFFMHSFVMAHSAREALAASLKYKDIAMTESLLAAGACVELGMLARCKTRAQAEILVAYGASFDAENQTYGFLPSRIQADAEPELLAYFLQNSPLNFSNFYGKDAYDSLLKSLTKQDKTTFDIKLQLLFDYGCFCDIDYLLFAINERLSDLALGDDREGVRKKFETMFTQYLMPKRTSIVALLRKRERTGRSFDLMKPSIAYEQRKNEIDQYAQKKVAEAEELAMHDERVAREALLSS